MRITVNQTELELVEGDITTQETDAIVNAAHASLLGGGGVDGAIHRAGGSKILEECKKQGGCETGQVRITTGGNLPSRYVIHAVGPIYQGGKNREDKLLASCYRKSLETAEAHGLQSIAFPSISTGAFGYPVSEAASVAIQTVYHYCLRQSSIRLVRFVLFDPHTFQAYQSALQKCMDSVR